MVSRLEAMTRELYDAKTPAPRRRDLSMDVACLRAKILRTRDPLGAMTRASENGEEC